jgi:hypothetical protein
MAQARAFDWDIFISYPREINQPGAADIEWVSEFYRLLKQEIQERTSGDLRIYFDEEHFKSNDHLMQDVLTAARRSFIFMPILSPRYVAPNKFTLKELEAFCDGGDTKGRIVSVELLPVPNRPAVLYGPKRNTFYRMVKGTAIKLSPVDHRPDYFTTLQTIAEHIAQLLQSRQSAVAESGGKTAWLAEKPDGLNSEWERIRSYLEKELRLRVLPEEDYPADADGLRSEAAKDLESADIFVQLLSPEDEASHREDYPDKLSRGQLQSDAAKAVCTKRGERLLQWRKPVKQSAYKHWDASLLNSREVVAGSLADFEAAIAAKFDELQKREQGKPKQAREIEKSVLLINAARDDEEIAKALMEQACAALESNAHWTAKRVPMEGSPQELEDALDDNLAACDAVWFVYGRAFSSWVDRQLLRCKRIASVRGAPIGKDQRAILLVPPPRSRDIPWPKTENVMVDLQNGISDERVRALIDKLPPGR